MKLTAVTCEVVEEGIAVQPALADINSSACAVTMPNLFLQQHVLWPQTHTRNPEGP